MCTRSDGSEAGPDARARRSSPARLSSALALLVVGVHALAPPPLDAQVIDRGTFTLFMNGVRIGEERFVLRHERGGAGIRLIRAVGELNVKVSGETRRIRVALESAAFGTMPRRYESEIDAGTRTRILGVLRRDRLKINIRSPDGEEIRQFLVQGPGAILDPHVAHHYAFFARLLDDREEMGLTIVTPRTLDEHRATLRAEGQETIQVGRAQVRARHLVLSVVGRGDHHIWVDGDRVLRVELPADGWVAVRNGAGSQPADRQGG